MVRPAAILLGVALFGVLVVVGLDQAGDRRTADSAGTPPVASYPLAAARRRLAGSPAPLAALHAQAAELLGGGLKRFDGRLAGVRGYPVVVNKWGSWCGPCRDEFPHFQRAAARYGKRIAFIGVNGEDNGPAARRFLRSYPVAYPSYVDDKLAIARRIRAPQAFPATAFFDRRGELAYVKQGSYATVEALAADIRRYAR